MGIRRKRKRFFPDEEIIDGFSIFSFDKYKNLEKFSKKKIKSVHNSVCCNKISKTTIPNVDNENLTNDIKVKKPKEKYQNNKASIRVTTKRKSKPDINTLSISSCRQKRKYVRKKDKESTTPLINSQIIIDNSKDINENYTNNKIEEDSSIKPSQHNIQPYEVVETVKDILEIIDNTKLESPPNVYVNSKILSQTECLNNCQINNFVTKKKLKFKNSTVSPVSTKPRNILQFERGPSDFNSIDFENNNMNKKTSNDNLLNDEDHNNLEGKIIIDKVTEIKNQGDRIIIESSKELRENKESKNGEANCLIMPIEFDSNRELSNIAVSSYLSEVPELKPEPTISVNHKVLPIALKTIVLPPTTVKIEPLPLIPTPAKMFTFLQKESFIIGTKYRSRKRYQMKSSILNSYRKNVMVSSPTVAEISGMSLIQNNINYSLRQTLTTPTITTTLPFLYSKSNLCSAINSDGKLSKCGVDGDEAITTSLIKPLCGPSQFTLCHAHITKSIDIKLDEYRIIDTLSQQHNCLIKPQPLRPLLQLFHPCGHFSSINVAHTADSFSLDRLSYPKNSIQTFSSIKSMRDLPILIKPFNRIPLTRKILNNSTFPNSQKLFPRTNVLLLKQHNNLNISKE